MEGDSLALGSKAMGLSVDLKKRHSNLTGALKSTGQEYHSGKI